MSNPAKSAIGFPTYVPQSAFGANDRIVYGHIGVGGMGSSHIVGDSCAALCDVDANHLASAAKRVQGKPMLTDDYRRVLDRKDIDAVTIGTPDHWHAIMAVHACMAGKDVYSEKPVCKTIEEGLAMVNAARRYKRIMQIGAQGRSNPKVAAAANYLRNGKAGDIKKVVIWHPENLSSGSGFETPSNPPSHMNWDMWLGPIPYRPYTAETCHFHFRWMMDSGAGFIRDRGNHALSCVMLLTGQDAWSSPVTVKATGKTNPNRIYDAPQSFNVTWKFRNPEWTLEWNQPGEANERLEGEWGATYYGTKDDLILTGGDGGADTEPKAIDYVPPTGGFKHEVEPDNVDVTEKHRRNWRKCIKTRELPVSDIGIQYKTIILPIIANIAYVVGRELTFDPKTNRFINDEEANRFLSDPYREPWSLKGY